MPPHPKSYPDTAELTLAFSAHAAAEVIRLRRLVGFFEQALPLVDNAERANQCLTELGRPDLAITERAAMQAVSHPRDVHGGGLNFAPKFAFYTSHRTVDEDQFGELATEPVPATREEILALRELPKFYSRDEVRAYQHTGRYPALRGYLTHSQSAAFLRILTIFPDFTADLVQGISNPNHPNEDWRFENELCIAYELMSRLVDTSDRGVTQEGAVRPDYLLS